jgi:fructose/tagatose bisphosphate aldolase
MGVSRITFSTVMRKGAIETLTKTLNANPGELDFMKLLTPARLAMVEIAKHHFRTCMSDGKAWN